MYKNGNFIKTNIISITEKGFRNSSDDGKNQAKEVM